MQKIISAVFLVLFFLQSEAYAAASAKSHPVGKTKISRPLSVAHSYTQPQKAKDLSHRKRSGRGRSVHVPLRQIINHGKGVSGSSSCHMPSVIRVSYYNKGTKTANGERFNKMGLTAAVPERLRGCFGRHFRLVWGGRKVIVRPNDILPPVSARKGRTMDLTEGAARQLGFVTNGLAIVRVESI